MVEESLEQLGICFCFAPLLHQAMRHVAPVRRKLGTPTISTFSGRWPTRPGPRSN